MVRLMACQLPPKPITFPKNIVPSGLRRIPCVNSRNRDGSLPPEYIYTLVFGKE